MATVKRVIILTRLCLFLVVTLTICSACQSSSAGKRPSKAIDGHIIIDGPPEFMGLPLQSGQIVMSEAGGPMSVFFSLLSEEYYSYLHVGIMNIENGKPFVYEALGNYLPISGLAPTDGIIGGGIHRTPLKTFVKRKKIVAIYDPPPSVKRAPMIAFAIEHYNKRTAFDAYFDNSDRDKLYCSEFVAVAMEAGGEKNIHTVPFRRNNPSINVLLDWLKITAESNIPAGSLVRSEDYIGTLSNIPSITRVRTFLELKRELHARFTPDQRLGNLFSFEDGKLKFRDPVRQFVKKGIELYDLTDYPPDEAAMRLGVQRFAADFFGPSQTPVP